MRRLKNESNMPDNAILVSFVVTVYNKEPYLPATVRSLIHQERNFRAEYIFVDDVSKDCSVEVVERETAGLPDVMIIKNSDNQGPSRRLNQGVRLAQGKYVLCFDSDDILAANAAQTMVDLLEKHSADVIYGQWEKTESDGESLLSKRVTGSATSEVSDKPLEFVLNGRFLRMALMARRSIYLTAGGADERILIQDESLPIRLAVHAKRFMALHAPVMFVPKIEGALSRNVAQLNHDRFLAYYYLLKDYPQLDDPTKRLAYRRAVSAGWKQLRHEKGMWAMLHWVFREYMRSRSPNVVVKQETLQHLFHHMAALQGVRRVG